MNPVFRLSALAAVVLATAGCTTTAFTAREYHEQKRVLGEAIHVRPVKEDRSVLELCKARSNDFRFCGDLDQWKTVTVNLSRNPFIVWKIGVVTPATARIKTAGVFNGGTIIEVETIGIDTLTASKGKSGSPSRFIGIAAEPDDPTCRWEGSKISTWGGVVCPRLGYDYRKILNPDRK